MNEGRQVPRLFVHRAYPMQRTNTGQRSHVAVINDNVLYDLLYDEDIHANEPKIICFNLFDDAEIVLETQAMAPFEGKQGIGWRGRMPNAPNVYGYLFILGDQTQHRHGQWILSGSLMYDGQGYHLQSIASDKVRIVENVPLLASCGMNPASGEVRAMRTAYSASLDDEQHHDASGSAQELSVIHVLAVYAPSVKDSIALGSKGIEVKVGLAATLTNDVFARSKIPARIEITTRELDVLKQAGNVVSALHEITTNPAGTPPTNPQAVEAVNRLRDELKADVVVVLTADAEKGIVGLASCIPEPPMPQASSLDDACFAMALQILGYDYDVVATYTFTHELGHLMGARHDRITTPERWPNDPKYDYVRGYIPEDKSFVTIMGYANSCACKRVPCFSDADSMWDQQPLGIPIGQPDAASAAPFLRTTAPVIASYRSKPQQNNKVLVTNVDPPLAGTIVCEDLGPYQSGAHIVVKALPRAPGYRFIKWVLDYVELPSTNDSLTLLMDSDHKLTALFDAGHARHPILTKVLPEEVGTQHIIRTPSKDVYDIGEDVSLALSGPENHQFAFVEWKVDGKPAGRKYRLNLRTSGRHIVEAHYGWREFAIRIEAVPASAGTVRIADDWPDLSGLELFGAARHQSLSLLPIAADASTAPFQMWRVNGEPVPGQWTELNRPYLDVLVAAPLVIEACFEGWESACHVETRAIPAEAAALLIEPHGHRFLPGADIQIRYYPRDDAYRFVEWLVGAENGQPVAITADTCNLVVEQDTLVRAVFEQLEYTLTCSVEPPEAASIVSPIPLPARFGKTQQAVIQVTARNGWALDGWTLNGNPLPGPSPTPNHFDTTYSLTLPFMDNVQFAPGRYHVGARFKTSPLSPRFVDAVASWIGHGHVAIELEWESYDNLQSKIPAGFAFSHFAIYARSPAYEGIWSHISDVSDITVHTVNLDITTSALDGEVTVLIASTNGEVSKQYPFNTSKWQLL
jgi:hypothetical protein